MFVMANTKDNLSVSSSVPEKEEEVISPELAAKPVETDQDESKQVESGSSMAPKRRILKPKGLNFPDEIWYEFFDNIVGITDKYDPIETKSEEKSEDKSEEKSEKKSEDQSKSKAEGEYEGKSEKPDPKKLGAPITRRPRIELVKFPEESSIFVAQWTWDVPVNNCSLCRNDINYLCVECQAGECMKLQSEVSGMICMCSLSQGRCKHFFHTHCILRWLLRRPVCPLCGKIWMTIKCTS